MTLPSTTKEPTFEELVDAFEVRARMLAGVGRDHVCYKTFHETRDATRSALLDYVRKLEENALTAEEAQSLLNEIPGDSMWAMDSAIEKLDSISRSAPQLKDK